VTAEANDLLEYAEADELRETARRLQQKLAKAQAKTEELIRTVYEAARDAALMQPPVKPTSKPKVDRRRRRPEIALGHLTDLQFGKATESYSRATCEARVGEYVSKTAALTEIQRSDHPVRHGHLMLGGDMVEGTKIFPGQVYEIEAYLYDQLFGCARLIEQTVRSWLGIYEHVTVWEESGNHGRMGKKGEDPASDNIDRMAYRIARDRLENEPRLSWVPQESWYRIVEIGNYRALLVHGDEIKSFGGNTPAFGILRKCNAWASGVVEPFHDVYMGHFHTNMVLTLANGGRVFVSSSTESGSVYAQEFVAATGIPAQRVNFIDPERGRVTSEYVCWLD
jgi:hypothetical protein